MVKKILMVYLFIITLSNSQEIGCLSSIKSKDSQIECSKENPLEELKEEDKIFALENPIDENKKDIHKVNITEKIKKVDIKFKGKIFTIERVDIRECPPFCISPYKIKGIKSVGELETIEFIKSLEKRKGRILVDARGVGEFKKSTIPTAVNIPYNILEPKSPYKDEVLRLLGAVKLKRGWYFKKSYKLLIFDNGIVDNKARKLIKRLIKYGYPKNKILYYRGGLDSWKSLGLTTI